MKNLLLFLFCLIPVTANADRWNLNQIAETSCRVQAGSVYGSGNCIDIENGKVYILTNKHVVGNNKTVYCEFFKNGRKTTPIPGTVVWSRLEDQTEIDFALVAIDLKYFGKYPPRVAKIAPNNITPVAGYVMSSGYPGASWTNSWEGFVIEDNGSTIKLYPAARGGQSGSGVFILAKNGNSYETYLYGVITWRVEDSYERTDGGYENAISVAINIQRFLGAIKGQASTTLIPENYKPIAITKETAELVKFPRLIPRPDPTPTPDVTPDVPTPGPTPDNPYNDLPDFDFGPELAPEPVVPPSNTSARIKKLIDLGVSPEEAEIKVAEFVNLSDEQFDVFAQILGLTQKTAEDKAILEEEKTKLEEKVEKPNWTQIFGSGGLGAFLSSVLTYLLAKGKLRVGSLAVKKVKEVEDKFDATEDKLEQRIKSVLGQKASQEFRTMLEGVEKMLIADIENKLTKQAQSTVEENLVDEVAKTIVDSLDPSVLKAQVNKKIISLLK